MLEKYIELLDFKVNSVALSSFKKMAESLHEFEEAIFGLHEEDLNENGTEEAFKQQEPKFLRARNAKGKLTPNMLKELDKSFLETYQSYEKKYIHIAAIYDLNSKKHNEFARKVELLGYLVESGNGIPSVAQMIQREKEISEVKRLMEGLIASKVAIAPSIKVRVDGLQKNLDRCLAPMRISDFIGKGFRWEGNLLYEGEFKNGNFYGKGKYKWPSGQVYEGEFKDGEFNGWGTMKYPDGRVYEGEWKNNSKCGKGKEKYSNGQIYEGEWEKDGFNGHGKYKWPSGQIYDGEFKDGLMSGLGTMRYPDGRVYEGEWRKNTQCGKGKIKYANGEVYEGEFQDGQRHGEGVQKDKTGNIIYDGRWLKDKESPTAEHQAYISALDLYKKTEYSRALDFFLKCESFRDASKYIEKCQYIIIQAKKAEEDELKQNQRASRRKTTQYLLSSVLVFLIALELEGAGIWVLRTTGYTWYMLFGTAFITILYSAFAYKIEKKFNASRLGAEINMKIHIPHEILMVALNIALLFILPLPIKGNAITFTVFNIIVLLICENMIFIFDYGDVLMSKAFVPCLICFLAFAGAVVASREAVLYAYDSSRWHTLWITPAIIIGFSIIFSIALRCITGLKGNDATTIVVAVGVLLVALIAFIQAIVVICSIEFSVGIFFFIVLNFIIDAGVWFGGMLLGVGIAG